MRQSLTIVLLIFLSSCFSNYKNEWQYVAGNSEIPLFQGLEIIKDETANFDSISGNITSSSYRGYINLEVAEKFYSETLAQLGWKLLEKQDNRFLYQRSIDKLEITFKREKDGLVYINFLASSNPSEQ